MSEPAVSEQSVPTAAQQPRRLMRPMLIAAVIVAVLLLVSAVTGRYLRIRSLSAQCKDAMHHGRWARLETVGAKLRYWQPNKAAPIIFLAEAANQKGDLERAAALLADLPDGDPMTAPALVERAHLLFGPLNRPIKGAETLERSIRLDPMQPEARRRLIYFYAFTLQRRKMVHHCYDAIEHDCDIPETYIYLFSQDWLSFANAFDENSRWLAGNPDEELFLVARAIYRITSKALDVTDEPSEADIVEKDSGLPFHKQVVAKYFERFPKNIELLAYHLNDAATSGDIPEVAKLLEKAPPEAAEDNRFWRFMGWLYRERGQLREAEDAYRKALTINPYDYVTHHQLAAVERRLNQPEQVKTLEALALEGRNLRKEILQLPNVTSVPPELLRRMANHAGACGDTIVANKLYSRVK